MSNQTKLYTEEDLKNAFKSGAFTDLFNTWDIKKEDYAKEKAEAYIKSLQKPSNSHKLEILIKPKVFVGCNTWEPKMHSVVLVEKPEHIDLLWKLLCEQDNYWFHFKSVIQVAPKEINGVEDIIAMCVWCGKTDIDNPDELKTKIPFIMYQEHEYYEE